MPEPYGGQIVPRKLKCLKNSASARVIGVLGNTAERRGMALIPMPSRCVRAGDVHELVSTIEAGEPGGTVDGVGYVAWIAFDAPAVLIAGDTVHVNGKPFGEICGFDETHAPNHFNIIVRTPELLTGRALRLEPDMPVTIVGQTRASLGW